MKLMQFQEKAVSELKKTFYTLWRDGNNGAQIVFKAPTGSGKTIMTAEFLKRITGDMQFEADKAFVWVSFNTESYEQSKKSLFNYYNGGVAGLNLLDLNDINNGKLEKNEIFFVNWQKLVSKATENRKLRTDGESNISFDTFIQNTHDQEREIVLIIDEAHLAKDTPLAGELIALINPKIEIHISATPRHIPDADELSNMSMGYVPVVHKDVVQAGLIKEKIEIMPKEEVQEYRDIATDTDLDTLLIDLAITKQKELRNAYNKIDVNPLVMIQLPNDEKEKRVTEGQSKLDFIKEYLTEIGVQEHKIAVWLSEKKENLEEVVKNNSEVDFLIFKQAAATGWDCPRAQVLVMFREIKSPIFKTQVLGRILRMPEAKAYTNSVLNRAYVYTNYERDSIEKGNEIGVNKVAIYKSRLRDDVENIELNSVFLSRGSYNDLGDSFQQTFIPIANKYFKLTGKESEIEAKKKLKKGGLDADNTIVTNKLIVDADIEVYDDFQHEVAESMGTLDYMASYHDTQKLYNLLLWREIAHQDEDSKKYAPERSYGKLKTAINVWLREYLDIQNPPLYAIVCNDLESSNSVLRKVIAKALGEYKSVRNKEIEEKVTKSEEKIKFILQEQYSYTDDFEIMLSITKSANLPFYTRAQYKGKENEESFMHYLEERDIDWWFKNGDYGRNNFAIKYKDENGELKLFYPDFLVKQGNKLGIFDTKSGITAKEAKYKAEALYKFIKAYKGKYNLWGGIVVPSGGLWKLNDNKKYEFNERDLSDWDDLEF